MKLPPRLRFAHLPTSIEPLPRLSSLLKGQRLLVKRDDQTGLALGGNKTRKLEFLVAEAQAHGARTLITAGAIQSNHCRQTAAAAARFGFDCILVLSVPEGEQVASSQASPATGNLLLDALFGARVVWTTYAQRDQALKDTFQKAWEDGKRPYLIPYGGSNPTGAAAYAFAIQELVQQGAQPDWVVFPSSSGGTQAGMLLGQHLFGFQGKLLGISVDEAEEVLTRRVAKLASETADLLDEKLAFQPQDVLVDAHYLGGGYGVVGEPEKEALHLFAQSEGMLLDPVYTARAAAGMIDLIRKGFFNTTDTVLFWHTGGTPALFADRYQDIFQ